MSVQGQTVSARLFALLPESVRDLFDRHQTEAHMWLRGADYLDPSNPATVPGPPKKAETALSYTLRACEIANVGSILERKAFDLAEERLGKVVNTDKKSHSSEYWHSKLSGLALRKGHSLNHNL